MRRGLLALLLLLGPTVAPARASDGGSDASTLGDAGHASADGGHDAGQADAGSMCRVVQVSLEPIPKVQMAVWVEDSQGNYVDTLYVTRLTGTLGLANRPGLATWKSDYRYPYGAREMVMPVWARARNRTYGKVVMGGALDNSSGMRIGDTTTCPGDCDNLSIGYHFNVSSTEPFYCGPSGGAGGAGLDATSCASAFYGSKGAYLTGATSYYPPRADLTSFDNTHDSIAATMYSSVNDLGAVSGATPPGNAIIDPPIAWTPPHDGAYVMKVEVSSEYDFNAFHVHDPTPDEHSELQSYGLADSGNTTYGQPGFKYGKGGFGQPSIVYAVPFNVGAMTEVDTTSDYVGYGDWDGATGTMHAPDMTITTGTEGTGLGRLLLASDAAGQWRVKVLTTDQCTMPPMSDGGMTCALPDTPTGLSITPGQTSLNVAFASATTGAPTTRFDVRYSENGAITDSSFTSAIPSSMAPPSPGMPGSTVDVAITGLRPTQTYAVAVRALSSCGAASPIAEATATTGQQKFVVLHGCFIATAAYGTTMATELDSLRHLRDRYLLGNPLGSMFVATYYTFSPAIARVIATREDLRAGTRSILAPLVAIAQTLDRVAR